jgi:uncharacterized membrane protein
MSDPVTPPVTEDRTVAILTYITIVGFIIAIVMHSSKKTALGAFHLRQGLGLFVTALIIGAVSIIPILGWIVALVGMVVLFIIWLMGLIAAASGQQKPAPILGEKYQQWFANAFN